MSGDVGQSPRELGMARISEGKKGVFWADEPVVVVGRQDIEFLKRRVQDTERKRNRLCAHKDEAEHVHEMFMVLSKEAYVRPHKHPNKAESLHVVEGRMDVVLFDEVGGITEVIPLEAYSCGRRFYYRVSRPTYHSMLIRSDFVVYHETTEGPFLETDSVDAIWSPEESDFPGVKEYMERLGRFVADIQLSQGHRP